MREEDRISEEVITKTNEPSSRDKGMRETPLTEREIEEAEEGKKTSEKKSGRERKKPSGTGTTEIERSRESENSRITVRSGRKKTSREEEAREKTSPLNESESSEKETTKPSKTQEQSTKDKGIEEPLRETESGETTRKESEL